MITKTPGDYYCHDEKWGPTNLALTLSPEELGENPDGWVIKGEVQEDYYEWVNSFEATHPDFGRVWGDYEEKIYACSEEAFNHFFEHHPPSIWDYWDI